MKLRSLLDWIAYAALAVVAALLFLWAYWAAIQIPADAEEALSRASTIELFSLDPSFRHFDEVDSFHRWKVLGRTQVADPATVQFLVSEFRQGVRNYYGLVALCFNPRHGMRVADGLNTFDFVICFECMSVEAYRNNESLDGFLTTGSPQPEFDRVLTDAGVPLPPARAQ